MTSTVNDTKEAVRMEVKRFLRKLAAGHEFGGHIIKGEKAKPHRNCVTMLAAPYTLIDSEGRAVEVPAGSEVVIYRDPNTAQTPHRKVKLACIHVPRRDRQIHIYPGAVIKERRKLEARTTTLGLAVSGSSARVDHFHD